MDPQLQDEIWEWPGNEGNTPPIDDTALHHRTGTGMQRTTENLLKFARKYKKCNSQFHHD